MRDAFPEYYPLSPVEERACIVEGTIVLDTNVLYALYRFSTAEREQLLHVLEQVQNRLWIPHQVALEYQRGRESVIKAQAGQYEKVVSLVSAPQLEDLTDKLRGLSLPDAVREDAETLVAEYVDAVRQVAAPFVERASEMVASHVVTQEQGRTRDPVRERLDAYLAGKVGPRVDDKARNERIKTALDRYASAIPPGFKDSKKNTDELRAGDYLLWRELLDHAATLGSTDSVLFVTGDVKEDWFTREGDPLPALRREFAQHSPATYHQVSYPDFLNLANTHLDSQVPQDTIDRAAYIRPTDFYWSSSEDLVDSYLASPLPLLSNNREDYIGALLDHIGDTKLSEIPKDQENYIAAMIDRLKDRQVWSLAGSDEAAQRSFLQQLLAQRLRQGHTGPGGEEPDETGSRTDTDPDA